MGKHSSVGGGRSSVAAVAPARRAHGRRRALLGAFAIAACIGVGFVEVAAPAAGASASPYYQAPVVQSAPAATQSFRIAGGYVLVDVKRDKYTIYSDQGGFSDPAAGAPTVPAGTAQAYAASLVAARGWDPSQFTCLVQLWNRESGWNSRAANPSGAFGIPQALPGSKMGAGWQTDYRVQVRWGIGYIAARYGSPCGAWNSEISRGSY